MRILINFADEKYKKAQRLNSWSGKCIGKLDKVYSFSPEDLDLNFVRKHEKILNEKRGGGLWLWKPYFIDRVLESCNDGDIVFYCDSGAVFIRPIDELINSMKHGEDVWVSDNPLLECCFTKPSCFNKMHCQGDEYERTNQIQATYLMLRNSQYSREFVKEWLALCCDETLIWPEENLNLEKNTPYQFVAHREDQSLLSLLCKKRGVRIHRDPSQRGIVQETFKNDLYAFRKTNHEDVYKTIIYLHKSGTVNCIHCLRQIINTILLYYFPDRRYRI